MPSDRGVFYFFVERELKSLLLFYFLMFRRTCSIIDSCNSRLVTLITNSLSQLLCTIFAILYNFWPEERETEADDHGDLSATSARIKSRGRHEMDRVPCERDSSSATASERPNDLPLPQRRSSSSNVPSCSANLALLLTPFQSRASTTQASRTAPAEE